jgi:hypothetical protein
MKRKDFWQAVVVGLFTLIFVLMPLTPVRDDGGPIVKDPEVWVQLEEDEQIAVVRLGEEDTAQTDHSFEGVPNILNITTERRMSTR